jgi:hypothetical protein
MDAPSPNATRPATPRESIGALLSRRGDRYAAPVPIDATDARLPPSPPPVTPSGSPGARSPARAGAEGKRSRWSSWRRRRAALVIGVAIALLGLGIWLWLDHSGAMPLLWHGEDRAIHERAEQAAPVPAGEPTVLVLALDGVPREMLYRSLRARELPRLAELLGGADLAHAHLDDTVLSTLPSSTIAAWATIFTGEPPAVHGVAGNEYFVREERRFAAPAPVSIATIEPVLQIYAEGYANDLLAVPTLYERLRARDPALTAWVSASQFHRGADRLLLAERDTLIDALGAFAGGDDDDERNIGLFAELDRESVETVIESLDEHPAPKVLTLYLTGPDHFAHGSVRGPEHAITRYLDEIVDPLIGRLADALIRHQTWSDRHVVVVSDHGHTEVLHDEVHALSTGEEDDPPAVMRGAGLRLRPFELEVPDDHDFDAVLAYGGAMAYAYVADRSTCPQPGDRCDWARPPRWEEDVVPLAEAFFRANERGEHAPGMRGTLDLVLVREPRPHTEDAAPFEVYLGDGRSEPIEAHLRAHPRSTYVAVETRLRDLAVGPRGHHAGDVLLIARNGAETRVEDRYYFASLYRSWHGSPSRADSEIPLIVAHPGRTSAELGQIVRRVLGEEPRQSDVARVIEALLGAEDGAPTAR